MNKFIPFLIVVPTILFPCRLSAQQEPIPGEVLFVGNSYTYFWNLSSLVELMAKERGIVMETRHSTSGGVSLGTHWRGERGLQTRERIGSGDYDAVVLQDYSTRAIEHPDSLLYFGTLLIDEIRAAGSKPYLYLTWARKWNPLMQDQISKMYRQLGKEKNVEVVPVGVAWEMARSLRPDIELYDPDGSHPSLLGTYLTACVFFAALTGQSPVGLPHRLKKNDENGEDQYLMILDPNDAQFCQEVAAKLFLELEGNR